MKTNIITFLQSISLILLTNGCNEKFEYKKEINIPPKKSFFKVMRNPGEVPMYLNLKIEARNHELFDFNVIDKLSYNNFKTSQNPKDLIFVHKIQDRKKLDTNIRIPKGVFLFGFENFANNNPIKLNIKIKTSDNS